MKNKAGINTDAGEKPSSSSIQRKHHAKCKLTGNRGADNGKNIFLEWKDDLSAPVTTCKSLEEDKSQHFSPRIAATVCLKVENFPEDTLSARNCKTLLIAEDDELVRSLISLVLKQQGYRVIEAGDGNQAVEKYIANRADISALILDVILPKRSGKEVYDFIRNIVPEIRTLFISGYATETIVKKGVEGCYHVITKPFTPGMLLETVRKVLD